MTDHPDTHRAAVVELALRFCCPVCQTEIDSYIDAEPSDDGGFAVPVDQQFDLCSHCGALLDFGLRMTQEAA